MSKTTDEGLLRERAVARFPFVHEQVAVGWWPVDSHVVFEGLVWVCGAYLSCQGHLLAIWGGFGAGDVQYCHLQAVPVYLFSDVGWRDVFSGVEHI